MQLFSYRTVVVGAVDARVGKRDSQIHQAIVHQPHAAAAAASVIQHCIVKPLKYGRSAKPNDGITVSKCLIIQHCFYSIMGIKKKERKKREIIYTRIAI